MIWKEKSYELWGDTWKAQLSKLAQVNPRTVRRWATGELNIKQMYVDKINATYEIWRNLNKDK